MPDVLSSRFPWCAEHEQSLRNLFASYVERKLADALLDYDDLLLWWANGLRSPAFADRVACQFDHLLVDEFQDTNSLQMQVLLAMRPSGEGVFAVGDDAQSIYSFRAARVEHMHGFPKHYSPPALHHTLTSNYRSCQAVLNTANALMQEAQGPYKKNLQAARLACGAKPILAIVHDDAAQAQYVIDQVLAERENGVALKSQAVLFRTAYHSDHLEIALTRANIPFVKHGGLKFVEAAHVRDYLALLRWSQNPQHHLAAFRTLQLMPGIGPAFARQCLDLIASSQPDSSNPFELLHRYKAPPQAIEHWQPFATVMQALADQKQAWSTRLELLKTFIEPLVSQRYDEAPARKADIAVLTEIANQAGSAESFLSDMALDPPNATGGWSEDAHLDEDFLILSTVHSAKGQEWHNVFVLNVADGSFPNEYATSKPQAIEEERRLLYVAMTRAQHNLHLVEPQRYYITHQPRNAGAHVYGTRSRFLSTNVLGTLNTDCPVGKGSVASKAPPATRSSAAPTKHADSPVANAIRDLF